MTAASAASRVAVVGLGYIGLPTAACLATGGLHVTGVDVNAEIVERVNRGEAPSAEPDLSIAVSGAVAMGRLSAQTEMPAADAYIIAVPTPFTARLGAAGGANRQNSVLSPAHGGSNDAYIGGGGRRSPDRRVGGSFAERTGEAGTGGDVRACNRLACPNRSLLGSTLACTASSYSL
jgi:hypothetical protein